MSKDLRDRRKLAKQAPWEGIPGKEEESKRPTAGSLLRQELRVSTVRMN